MEVRVREELQRGKESETTSSTMVLQEGVQLFSVKMY